MRLPGWGWCRIIISLFGGGSETSSYRASLGFVEREGVIRNTNSRNFTTKLNITQHAFNDLLVFDLGIFVPC